MQINFMFLDVKKFRRRVKYKIRFILFKLNYIVQYFKLYSKFNNK